MSRTTLCMECVNVCCIYFTFIPPVRPSIRSWLTGLSICICYFCGFGWCNCGRHDFSSVCVCASHFNEICETEILILRYKKKKFFFRFEQMSFCLQLIFQWSNSNSDRLHLNLKLKFRFNCEFYWRIRIWINWLLFAYEMGLNVWRSFENFFLKLTKQKTIENPRSTLPRPFRWRWWFRLNVSNWIEHCISLNDFVPHVPSCVRMCVSMTYAITP